jgi:NADPH:quinone reductase-like Zn-dependent oxidoreductase
MKIIAYTQYGPPEVLHIEDAEKPAPKDNEVLIRVHAASINYGDTLARNFKAVTSRDFNMPNIFLLFAKLDFGWSKPKRKVLGSEFSGKIAAIGNSVTKFKTGDRVFGYLGQNMGAYAEYVCMDENKSLASMPKNLGFDEAATSPYGALMALNLLRKVNIQPGQKVLINGASGGIGSAAVQLAKNYFGATVTGVCGTRRIEYVKSLGADRTIDYSKEDFTKNGETYDLIFDVLGKSSFSRCKRSLNKQGIYLLASFKLKQLLEMLWTKLAGGKRVVCALAMDRQEDLELIAELIENGKFKAIVDKSFPMDQAAEAHAYVENGLKKGSVVIRINT